MSGKRRRLPEQGSRQLSAVYNARRCLEAGISVIPLGTPGDEPPPYFIKRIRKKRQTLEDATAEAHKSWPKTPRIKWKKYQTQLPTIDEFEGWAARWPGCNWGYLTGKLVCVDADTQESAEWLRGEN